MKDWKAAVRTWEKNGLDRMAPSTNGKPCPPKGPRPLTDEEMEAARGSAPDVVLSDGNEVVEAIAGLLEQLAPCGVLEPLVSLNTSAR